MSISSRQVAMTVERFWTMDVGVRHPIVVEAVPVGSEGEYWTILNAEGPGASEYMRRHRHTTVYGGSLFETREKLLQSELTRAESSLRYATEQVASLRKLMGDTDWRGWPDGGIGRHGI